MKADPSQIKEDTDSSSSDELDSATQKKDGQIIYMHINVPADNKTYSL